MDSMLNAFITESRDNLEVISNCFLALENDPTNAGTLDELFRSVHIMKGSSGLFDIAPFTKVVHAVEDVLDQVRDGEVTLTSEHIDLFLDSMDQVSAWLDMLEEEGELETSASSISDKFSTQLRAIIGSTGKEITEVEESVSVPELTAAPNWLMQLSHEARIGLFRQLQQADQHLLVVAYTPDKGCFFNGDDPIRLMQLMPGMETLVLETTADLPNELSTLDPFLCQIKCHALSSGDYDACHTHLKYVSDQCEFFIMDRSFLAVPEGDYAPTDAYQLFIDDVNFSAINADWEKLSRQVNEMAGIKANAPYQQNLIEWLAFLATERQPNARVIKALLSALKDGQFILENTQAVAEKVVAEQFTPMQAAMDDLVFAGQESDVLETAAAASSSNQASASSGHIDSGNGSHNANTTNFAETRSGDNDWNDDIAQELAPEQATAQNPDIAQTQAANVETQRAEADKNVVEELSDPLIHLVRNSLYHGLETPEERVTAGKSEQGTLTLRAIPHDEQRLDTITDQESLDLIFAAGYSTAKQISDLSGRGVGMDVVRTVIQEAGGTVGIEYKKTVAVFTDSCSIEDAESLLTWFIDKPKAKVNLKGLEHAHTAVIQLLLAFKPSVTNWPQSGPLVQILRQHLN